MKARASASRIASATIVSIVRLRGEVIVRFATSKGFVIPEKSTAGAEGVAPLCELPGEYAAAGYAAAGGGDGSGWPG